MKTLFKPSTLEDHHFLLASHMPNGSFWSEAFNVDDDFGKLLLGIAVEFLRFQSIEENLLDEMDINKTVDLLREWETSVGIPDECFGITESNENRQKQVLQKFSKFGGVQKAEDFVRVAAVFDIVIEVKTGSGPGSFPLTFPLTFFSSTKAMKHTIFIIRDTVLFGSGFPIVFPYTFIQGSEAFLQCLFNKLAPANVKVIIKNKGTI